MGRLVAAVGGLIFVVAMGACTTSSPLPVITAQPAPPTPLPTPPATAPPTPPATPPPTYAAPTAPDDLNCLDAIDTLATPQRDTTVVLDVVALPIGRVLQAGPAMEDGPVGRFFAKWGLQVRTDAVLDVRVPDGDDRFRINWGNFRRLHTRLHWAGCPGPPRWLAFAGGYYVDEPHCVTLLVSSAGRERAVRIGVGVPC